MSVSSALKKEGEVRVVEHLLCARHDAHPPSTVSCFLLLSALWGKRFCSTSEETSARRGEVMGCSHGLVSSRLSQSSGPAGETSLGTSVALETHSEAGTGVRCPEPSPGLHYTWNWTLLREGPLSLVYVPNSGLPTGHTQPSAQSGALCIERWSAT